MKNKRQQDAEPGISDPEKITASLSPAEHPIGSVIDLSSAADTNRVLNFSATEEQLETLAVRLQVVRATLLNGQGTISADKGGFVVSGTIEAKLTRTCVASLEDVNEEISEPFVLRLFREAPSDDEAEEQLDDWDVVEGDLIDFGELIVQQIALAMEPYPRKKGAPSLADTYGQDAPASPFAGLKAALDADANSQSGTTSTPARRPKDED
ncbi:MAG: DUF177 domain-containing protein [Pseudomonadota bacterium]